MTRVAAVAALLVGCSVLSCGSRVEGSGQSSKASATIRDLEGDVVGRATLTEGEEGVVISAELDGLPAGTHAMHVHAVGACEPPFQSAGGHAHADDRKHGILSPGGMHEGDLPNVHVPESGSLHVEAFVIGATLGDGAGRLPLLAADGSAIVIHANADDYATDPAGDAGERIACGVIER